MELKIDGYVISPKPNQSLYDVVLELGLFKGKLSTDPIAAKIAGRIFTLNYVPLREKDLKPERGSIRKAISASDGTVKLIYYSDPAGRDTYTRTAQFIIFSAINKLWPNATAKMACTVGASLYVKVVNAHDFCAHKLKEQVQKIVNENFFLHRRRIPLQEAINYFSNKGQEDKAKLLK